MGAGSAALAVVGGLTRVVTGAATLHTQMELLGQPPTYPTKGRAIGGHATRKVDAWRHIAPAVAPLHLKRYRAERHFSAAAWVYGKGQVAATGPAAELASIVHAPAEQALVLDCAAVVSALLGVDGTGRGMQWW